ncbi:hypothetical protein J1N35_012916 [Gossypium stocksii]|uniref:Uncharacterized protein n=1 Tax=Gossypium stocksii TaxID=47602 RepID=A0A9D3VRI1_9ROSI|nr:hypothetical protein J1N35_012916 [Gossypium stocksii]
MSHPTSPSVHSGASLMASNLSDGVDSRFFATNKINSNGVPQENPEFLRFEQQDSALASWLLSSVTAFISAANSISGAFKNAAKDAAKSGAAKICGIYVEKTLLKIRTFSGAYPTNAAKD